MGMNVVFLVLGIGLLFNSGLDINPVIFNLILFVTISIAAIMFAILLVCANKNWSRKVITSLVRFGEFITRGKWKKLYEIKEEALKETEIFHDSLKDLTRKPAALVLPTGLMAANWLCSIAVPYMVFLSLDVTIPWSVVLITSSIVVAVKSIPVGVPFEVGLPEITMTTLYTSLLGIDAAGICATVTILSRIITLWLRFGIGFAAQQWIELKSVFTPKPAAVEVQKN
jgi:uncharacterized protein (TIRG00374 family)